MVPITGTQIFGGQVAFLVIYMPTLTNRIYNWITLTRTQETARLASVPTNQICDMRLLNGQIRGVGRLFAIAVA